MEELAERDSVPIVHWETGRLLAVLCRVLDPVVLEVGTAIGYSTLHMAEQLERGRVVTLERDPERAAQAGAYLERGGVADRVEIVEGDALETLAGPRRPVRPPVRRRKQGRVRPLHRAGGAEALRARADGGGQPADERRGGAPRGRRDVVEPGSPASARHLNSELLSSERWLACVLPVGDGIGVAARR